MHTHIIDLATNLEKIVKCLQYWILASTSKAGSGHPSSSLSAVNIMASLFFGRGNLYHFDPLNPLHPNRDRIIFSKGHAAPLLYSLYAVAGAYPHAHLLSLRSIDSDLEGHPTPNFAFTEVPTGSLGMGLSAGVGMAYDGKYLSKLDYKTYVLLGDSELAEGSVFEAAQLATFYKLDNLIAFADINRLGQRGQTMKGWDMDYYQNLWEAIGWEAIIVDGHDTDLLVKIYNEKIPHQTKPIIFLAKTIKGYGVDIIADLPNWHGKALNQNDLEKALLQINCPDPFITRKISLPENKNPYKIPIKDVINPILTSPLATREEYGQELIMLQEQGLDIVVMDAEMSNSTFAQDFKEKIPLRFIECFIAEQNMVAMAFGIAKSGRKVYVSTFGAFLTRAFDQIRMGQYSELDVVFVGSHCGVTIGQDGTSQMALEDISMFRSLVKSTIFSASDARMLEGLVQLASKQKGIVYIRMYRNKVHQIYSESTKFTVGGSILLKNSGDDLAIITHGDMIETGLEVCAKLESFDLRVKLIDLYGIKPINKKQLIQNIGETKKVFIFEDHYPDGGLCDAVRQILDNKYEILTKSVDKIPRSGLTKDVLKYVGLDTQNIIEMALKFVQ